MWPIVALNGIAIVSSVRCFKSTWPTKHPFEDIAAALILKHRFQQNVLINRISYGVFALLFGGEMVFRQRRLRQKLAVCGRACAIDRSLRRCDE